MRTSERSDCVDRGPHVELRVAEGVGRQQAGPGWPRHASNEGTKFAPEASDAEARGVSANFVRIHQGQLLETIERIDEAGRTLLIEKDAGASR